MEVAVGNVWVENRPRSGWRLPDVRELWEYRELAWFLALRDVRVRYKQAVFGAGWAVLAPLAGAAAFTLVFRRLAQVPSGDVPYPLFAFASLAAWSYVSTSVTRATQSFVANVPLVTKVYFPRLLVPLAALLPPLLDLAVSLVLVVAVAAVAADPGWALLTLPLWVAGLLVVAFGVGLILATLNVRYRDVGQVTALGVQLWLFVSPVAYPASLVDAAWRPVYFLNPAAGVLEGFRWSVLGAEWPGAVLLVSLLAAVAVVAVAILTFQSAERRFADVI